MPLAAGSSSFESETAKRAACIASCAMVAVTDFDSASAPLFRLAESFFATAS